MIHLLYLVAFISVKDGVDCNLQVRQNKYKQIVAIPPAVMLLNELNKLSRLLLQNL